jgi:hypothetical protein
MFLRAAELDKRKKAQHAAEQFLLIMDEKKSGNISGFGIRMAVNAYSRAFFIAVRTEQKCS